MALATTSTEGEIVLGGDFTGTASVPILINTGVTSGTYNLSKYLTCDLKGRVISVGAETQANIDALVDAAYASSPSSFTIVSGRPVLNLPGDATNVDFGLVQLGANTGTTGTIPFSLATSSVFGFLKTDGTFKYNSGTAALEIDPLKMLFNQSGVAISNAVINQSIATPLFKTSFQVSNYNNNLASVGAMFALNNANCVPIKINPTNFVVSLEGMTAVASTGSLICRFYKDLSGDWFSAISSDGITWSTYKVAKPPSIAGTLTPLICGMGVIGSTFVVIGTKTYGVSDNWSAYSTDGINWTYNSTPWTPGHYIVSGLTNGFGKLIGVGRKTSNNTICSIYTTDGINWTLTTSSTSMSLDIKLIAYTDGVASSTTAIMIGMVPTTSAENCAYSFDGINWATSSLFSATNIRNYITANSSGIYVLGKIGSYTNVMRIRYSGSLSRTIAPNDGTADKWSLFIDDNNDLYVNDDSLSPSRPRKLSGFSTYSTVSPVPYSHPVRLGSQYVFCECSPSSLGNSSIQLGVGYNGLGGGGTGGTYTNIAQNSSGIVLPVTSYQGITRDVCLNLPYNQSPYFDSNNDYVVGTVLRLVLKNFETAADTLVDRKFEINFKKTGIVKVENNNERKFMNASSYKTFTAICTSSTEWLVFEE